MSTPVIVAIVEDGHARAYYRNGDDQLHQAGALAIGRAAKPELLATIMADLSTALDWRSIGHEPEPEPEPQRRKALPAARKAPPRGRPKRANVNEDIAQVVAAVERRPGMSPRQMAAVVWPDWPYTSALYQRALNRMHRARAQGLIDVRQEGDGSVTLHPVQRQPAEPEQAPPD